MAHTVEIKEIINGVQITETIDADIVVKLISYQSKPFLRTTNESAEETYQVLDIVGEIYNTPALATDFRIIDANDNVFIPANGVELIEYSLKIRAFRPDADINEVLAVGAITTTSNSVTLGLHAGGTNAVRIDGLTYEKYYPDLFNFTPVTTGEKILIIHALPDAQVFHLAQGTESTEAVEPAYSGLFVARLLVTTEGINIEEATAGFKEKANDGWRYITLADNDPKIIEVTASPSHSFNLQPLTIANEPKIVGIKSVGDKNTWDGNELLFYIDGDSEVTFLAGAYDEGLNYVTYAFAQTVIGKPYTYMRFKRKNWYYHHIPAGGGGKASEVENDSTVTGASVKDALETNANAITDLYIAQAKFTVTSSITNETLSTISNLKQNNRNNLIANGVNAINITLTATAEAKFQAIYHKLGSGTITFVAGAGVDPLILIDGTAKMEGAAGFQTAAVHRDGNKYYVQISNR